ncbi:MAG: hypothetical protein RI897_2149 [Verrucomicrobiota bacterium]|jgi:hypothetical protein
MDANGREGDVVLRPRMDANGRELGWELLTANGREWTLIAEFAGHEWMLIDANACCVVGAGDGF